MTYFVLCFISSLQNVKLYVQQAWSSKAEVKCTDRYLKIISCVADTVLQDCDIGKLFYSEFCILQHGAANRIINYLSTFTFLPYYILPSTFHIHAVSHKQ
jgi:hypothetical protein